MYLDLSSHKRISCQPIPFQGASLMMMMTTTMMMMKKKTSANGFFFTKIILINQFGIQVD